MSDVSQGPGWWQASDGKWYPPEQTPAAAAAGPEGLPLADWQTRAMGGLVDYVGIFILAFLVSLFSNALGSLIGLVGLVWALYNGYLNGKTGQSIGKRMAGTKVISATTGEVIGGGLGIVRYIAHIVDSLIIYIGWFMPLWDAKRQTVSDKIMGTVVITGLPKRELNGDIFND